MTKAFCLRNLISLFHSCDPIVVFVFFLFANVQSVAIGDNNHYWFWLRIAPHMISNDEGKHWFFHSWFVDVGVSEVDENEVFFVFKKLLFVENENELFTYVW